jgi:hypothetical protein
MLNGAALTGALDYRGSAASDPSSGSPALQAELQLGTNTLKLLAKAPGQTSLGLDARQLASLQPVLALWAPQAQLSGSARAQRWPASGGPQARSASSNCSSGACQGWALSGSPAPRSILTQARQPTLRCAWMHACSN